MSKEFNEETIEQYLNQELEGEALQAFQDKMNADTAFKKEVEFQSLLYRGANKYGEDELRSTLKRIRSEVLAEEETEKETTKKEEAKVVSFDQPQKKNAYFKWGIAAAIALVLGSMLFLIDRSETIAPNDHYANYYQPYSEALSVRSATNDSELTKASELYQDGNYEEALPLFLKIQKSEPGNAEILLATGICQLELDKMQLALASFKAINNPLYKDQATWYQAMTYLKNKDFVKAKSYLQSLKTGDANYVKAKELLLKIE